nr:DUF4738 domain-containing protein [uncultured Prevotella sp.]
MKRLNNLLKIGIVFFLFVFSLIVVSCAEQKARNIGDVQENLKAKAMLQGIWMNEDDESLAFRAEGDTIYYPDSISIPGYFKIVGDTLMLGNRNDLATYAIVKQTPHLFEFKNQGGDIIRLVKTEDPSFLALFEQVKNGPILNQKTLIKKDSVILYGSDRYHYYVQVNPTSYKVVKDAYNSDGVEVGNVYFDNIIHLSLFRGATKLFSKDFHKTDFTSLVPSEVLRQSVLSGLQYQHADASGFHFIAYVVVPDSPTSYLIEITINLSGRMQMKV